MPMPRPGTFAFFLVSTFIPAGIVGDEDAELRLLGRREDAEEATQEVFVRVMRSSSQFDGRSSMSTWLYQITTNYCLNQLRDRGRRRQLFEQNMQEDDHKSSVSVGDLVLLRRLLVEADEKQARLE